MTLDTPTAPHAGEARHGAVYDPATGERLADVPLASAADVDIAVADARAASVGWAATPLNRRAAIMFAIRDVLRDGADELARLIVRENGKTLADAHGEVTRGIESVEYACAIPQELAGSYHANAAAGIDVHSVRHPVGVAAAITPFNFPVMVPLWMLANAIACGNAVVFKPSEKAPSAPARLVEMLQEAGLPEHVVRLVHGDRPAVEALLDHPDVDAVSFVGSTPVAKLIYTRASAAGKRVQALGGAKNHMVVMPDADLDAAADAAIAAGYGAAGERCMAVSVIVAVDGVADRLIPAILERAQRLKVGAGDDDGVEMGPLISAEHRDRVAGYVASAADDGARVAMDGRQAACTASPGFFLGPTLIDDVTPDMAVYRDEIFGPVLAVVRVATFDEALALVRDHAFGNGTALFTRSGGVAQRFQRECRIGMVGINVPLPVPVAWSSFGGWKASLFGDAHMYGPEGIRFFTRQQVVSSRWPAH